MNTRSSGVRHVPVAACPAMRSWAARAVLILLLAGAGCGTWTPDVDRNLSTNDTVLLVVPERSRREAPKVAHGEGGAVGDERGRLDRVRIAARRAIALRFAILMRRWHRSFVTDVPI